jgi:hypothetical protein
MNLFEEHKDRRYRELRDRIRKIIAKNKRIKDVKKKLA